MIQGAARSDRGKKRLVNQDCYLIDDRLQLYLLADGMGGTGGGEEASKLTVSTIYGFVHLTDDASELTWPFGYDLEASFEKNLLRTAVLLANLKVCRASEEMEQFAGMGSTVVMVWIRADKAFWTHIGDSRLYLFRGGALQQLSEDHSLVQEQLRLGLINQAEAEVHSLRHVITKAIGSRERFEVDVQEHVLESGDLLMLCCDGLSNCVKKSKMEEILQKGEELSTACEMLVDAANEAGGIDNITVVLCQYTT
jgi:PPM family protein phosphatase